MSLHRRDFGRGLAAVAGLGTTTVWRRARAQLGSQSAPQGDANDRIGVGLIGCGNKGQALWKNFLAMPDVEPLAVCDVYQPFMDKGIEMSGGRAKGVRDFRALLDDPRIDAVIVATPDHWHALQTVAACRAGKDVYCEKPLSLFVSEGRVMVDEARKHQRVVQTGSQQRSGAHYAKAVKLVQDGAIGAVHKVTVGFTRNVMPGFKTKDLPIGPDNFDWEMWLGPAPKRAFDPFRVLYNFRWFWDYSGGQMTNFGAHHLDIVRWALGAKGPTSVSGFGGRFAINDGGETPDVQEVAYQFPNCVVTWSAREINEGPQSKYDIEFHGSKGTLALTRKSLTIIPERTKTAAGKEEPAMAALDEAGSELDRAHIANFLSCVKSRARPNADIEEGHRTAVMCHLGNIATRLGRSLRWDPEKETIVGDPVAAKMLTRPYRKPWSLARIPRAT
jgi:predicted dehydrogenase